MADGDLVEVAFCGGGGTEISLVIVAVGRGGCWCKGLLANIDPEKLHGLGRDVVELLELGNWKPELGVTPVAPGKSDPPEPGAESLGGSDFGGSEGRLPPAPSAEFES